ncbi:hypothetical protein AJ79_02390 [Helicocarpus griseus UAMH5409]|uniref:Uncharacterized protein n=1 Tax=Helicocarpus griseus UAMH5409 TaxID=1447875 RepID=A0A2B7XUH3_9EURO|nr:hypothetical protein AJ79_02390 [Helicocarpus griseus UAMH5409]
MGNPTRIAVWLSLTATLVGLGYIIAHSGSIVDQTDQFHALRGIEHLGIWRRRQTHIPWHRLVKPLPHIKLAKLHGGIHPTFQIDNHHAESSKCHSTEGVDGHIGVVSGWADVPLQPLVKHNSTTCTVISRATLMTLLCLTNARPVFRYSSASGHRAAYASYCGQWRIEVDKCLQMLAGVICSQSSDPNAFKCAFPGRKSSGKWVLEHTRKGSGCAHSGRHLYNMVGGDVTEVDFLLMKKFVDTEMEQSEETVILCLPNKENGACDLSLYVPKHELVVLNQALDSLPWTSLSWSVHRGLRDILIALAKERMDRYRTCLADTLRLAVARWPERLDARGWDPRFVRRSMADMAASAVLAGRGNLGDAVRIVTDIAMVLWDGEVSALDETRFWRDDAPISSSESSILNPCCACEVFCTGVECGSGLPDVS